MLVSDNNQIQCKFWAKLVKDKGLNFRIANLPNADNFQIHLFAAMAQQEREFISLRTKSALREWKAKNPNKKLGNPNIASINKKRKYKARQFASTISTVIMPLRNRGMTYQQIANTLNDMKMTTPKGCKFYPSQVKNVISKALSDLAKKKREDLIKHRRDKFLSLGQQGLAS